VTERKQNKQQLKTNKYSLIIAQLKISRQFVFSHKIPLKYPGRRPITSADYCFRWK
jgi:hypothetical protein